MFWFFIVLAIWLVGVVVSFLYGNRIMPTVIALLGSILAYGVINAGLGWPGIAVLTILSLVIWIANRIDMT